jgi:phosphoribosylglycinamide formyltransferase 1
VARRRVAVLISGGGSNLQALMDSAAGPGSSFTVVLVVSNRADAFGLVRAERARVPARVIEHARFASRPAFEAEVAAALDEAGAELVCLAGFMRVLGAEFVERYRERMLNIHPSLLPAFPGLRTHARALAAGVLVHGCTVHLVRPELDDGPILVQGVVPVLPGDDETKLAARVLEVEHRCYPLAVEAMAAESWSPPRLVQHPLLPAMAERGK